jgi:hypothetical protein
MSDALDDFLDRPPVSREGENGLRTRLRERTTRVLRWRRRGKRAAMGALLVGCYVAGLATMRWFEPATPVPAQQAQAPTVAKEAEVVIRPEVPEREAAEPPRSVALRQAGDFYLEQTGDFERALRCYSLSLNAGGAEALADSRDDNWLVMAIKDARRKEKINED